MPESIRRLVKQLFFRLNQQQFRNQKYKHKQNADALAESDDGYSKDAPIDVDSIIAHSSTDSPTIPAESAALDPPNFGLFDNNRPHEASDDVYEVPESNPTSPPLSPRPTTRFRVPINLSSRTKRTLVNVASSEDRDHQGKRQKRGLANNILNQKRESPRTNKSRGVQREGYLMGTDAFASIHKEVSPETEEDPRRPDDMSLFNDSQSPPHSNKPRSPPGDSSWGVAPEAPMMTLEGLAGEERDSTPLDSEQFDFRIPSLPDLQPPSTRTERETRSPSTVQRLPSLEVLPMDRHAPQRTEAYFAVAGSSRATSNVDKPADSRPESPLNFRHEIKKSKESRQEPIISPTASTNPATSVMDSTEGQKRQPSTSSSISTSISTSSKPSINFLYWVVLSRTPRTITERWSPQGRFQDKTLAELLKELPLHDSKESRGLIFTIDSDCMRTVERIANDDEESFGAMKRQINRGIRDWFHRQRRLGDGAQPPRLVIDIVIEEMVDDSKPEVDVEDLELEW